MKKEDVLRKCIVSGEILEKSQMLRFTISPDKIVVPDFKKKLPGKGIWVKNSKEALKTAIVKNLFTKANKSPVKTNLELVDMVEAILRKKGLDSVSLSRKAGILITGFEKVSDSLKKEKVAFVLEAKGAGSDGHNRIKLLAKNVEIFELYDVEELDRALDKENTVHIAFIKSEMAKTVYSEFVRFQAFLNS